MAATNYDFFSPFMSAAILCNGETYPLWTGAGKGASFKADDKRLSGLRALSFLSELTIDMNLGDIPRIAATLTPPYEDAIRFIDSELIEFGSNRLQVQFGYGKGASGGDSYLSPVWEGMLLKPEVTFGADMQIVLNAQGTGSNAAFDQSAGVTFKGTRKEAIEEICKRVNMVPKFDLVEKDSDSLKELNASIKGVAQGWRSNNFMLQLLAKECGCTARILRTSSDKQGEYEMIPRNYMMGESKPDITLSMFHFDKRGIGGDVFPIFTAQTPSAAIWLPGVRELLQREIDPKTRKLVEKKTSDKDVHVGITGKGASDIDKGTEKNLPQPDANKPIGHHPHHGDPGEEAFVKQAHDAFSTMQQAMGVKLDVETLGCPHVEPGHVVAIRGLGMRLDSTNYGVFKVIHTLSTNGFITQLQLVSNTGNLLSKQLRQPATGKENTNQPEESSPGVTANATPASGGSGRS